MCRDQAPEPERNERPASPRAREGVPSAGRKLLIVAGALLAFCVTQYLYCSLASSASLRFRIRNWGDVPFDSAVWKAADPQDPDCIRGKMLKSLLRDHRLKGLSRSEVLDLLGPPTATLGDGGYRSTDQVNLDASTWEYVIGMYSGFRIDYDSLDLVFSRKGRVRAWDVWQH